MPRIRLRQLLLGWIRKFGEPPPVRETRRFRWRDFRRVSVERPQPAVSTMLSWFISRLPSMFANSCKAPIRDARRTSTSGSEGPHLTAGSVSANSTAADSLRDFARGATFDSHRRPVGRTWAGRRQNRGGACPANSRDPEGASVDCSELRLQGPPPTGVDGWAPSLAGDYPGEGHGRGAAHDLHRATIRAKGPGLYESSDGSRSR